MHSLLGVENDDRGGIGAEHDDGVVGVVLVVGKLRIELVAVHNHKDVVVEVECLADVIDGGIVDARDHKSVLHKQLPYGMEWRALWCEPVVFAGRGEDILLVEGNAPAMQDVSFAKHTADVVAAFGCEFHHRQGVVAGTHIVVDLQGYPHRLADFGLGPDGLQHLEGFVPAGVAVEECRQHLVRYIVIAFHIHVCL